MFSCQDAASEANKNSEHLQQIFLNVGLFQNQTALHVHVATEQWTLTRHLRISAVVEQAALFGQCSVIAPFSLCSRNQNPHADYKVTRRVQWNQSLSWANRYTSLRYSKVCFLTACDPCTPCILCYLFVVLDLKHKRNNFAPCSLEIEVQTPEAAASLISKHLSCPIPSYSKAGNSKSSRKKGRFLTITHYLPLISLYLK